MATTRSCCRCLPARRAVSTIRATCSVRDSASRGRRRATATTAIRGGIGLFYDRPEGNLLFGGGGNGPVNSPPYVFSSQYENGNLWHRRAAARLPRRRRSATLAAIDPDLEVPRAWNWSVSYQRELPWGFFGEVGYVGSDGQNLLRQPDINQPSFEALEANAALPAAQRANTNFLRPYAGYSMIQMRLSDADSSYHAHAAVPEPPARRVAHHAQLYARSGVRQRQRQRRQSGGLSEQGLQLGSRATSTARTSWSAPGRGRCRSSGTTRTLSGSVLGGWELSGIVRLQSGAPLTVTGNTSIGARRADLVGDPYADSEISTSVPRIPPPSRPRRKAGAATLRRGRVPWSWPARLGPVPAQELRDNRRREAAGSGRPVQRVQSDQPEIQRANAEPEHRPGFQSAQPGSAAAQRATGVEVDVLTI